MTEQVLHSPPAPTEIPEPVQPQREMEPGQQPEPEFPDNDNPNTPDIIPEPFIPETIPEPTPVEVPPLT